MIDPFNSEAMRCVQSLADNGRLSVDGRGVVRTGQGAGSVVKISTTKPPNPDLPG